MARRKASLTTSLKTPLTDLAWAPFVVASRMPILMFEAMNPDPRQRSETTRMVTEKVAAAQEGMMAAQFALVSASINAGVAMLTGRMPDTPRQTASKVMAASLQPSARRVKANMRRLSRGG
jgi:hypothetical protein